MAITGFTGQALNTMQTIADATTVQSITPPEGTDFVIVEAHQHDIRVRFDGTDPTSTVGFKIVKDTPTMVSYGQDVTIKLIAIENGPAVYWQAFKTKRDNNA